MKRLSARFYRLSARIYLKFFRPDEMKSRFLRHAFKQGYDIEVGDFSYGCFDRDRFTPHMTIGRYCSFSRSCRRVNANHALGFLSLHPYFYNTKFGVVTKEQVERSHCQIGDDVWVGHNAVILPTVTSIGRGAVIAAGAIVTKNVPSYSIVAGVPAKVISKRFNEVTIAKIEASRWWELSREALENIAGENWEWVRSPELLPEGPLVSDKRKNLPS